MKQIDFLVIGTQKGGTKSVYSYLQAHPSVYLPYAHEVAFFCLDNMYAKGISWYLKEFFEGAREHKTLGEVSPQYMSRLCCAERIHEYFPSVRLIAILRNPIDRAYSAYNMMVQRTKEKRSFDEAIDQLVSELKQKAIPIESDELLDDYEYVRTGLYGYIMSQYLQFFPMQQIKILFTEDMKNDPAGTLRQLYEFIGVDKDTLPPNYQDRYHEGGNAKYPLINAVLESELFKNCISPIKSLVPKKMRMMSYRIQQWNVAPGGNPRLELEQRVKLADVFRPDVALLEQTFDVAVPWPDFK